MKRRLAGVVLLVAGATGGARAQGVGIGRIGALRPMIWQGTEPLVKDDLFAGTEKFAKGASDVTEVTMDPDTLDMVNGNGAKRAHNMVLNVVRTYSYDKPGMYRTEDVEEFRRKLNTGDWHCSVHTRSLKSGESTDVCHKRRADAMVETAIITVEPKELSFIHTIRRSGGGGGPEAGEGLLFGPGMSGAMAFGPEGDAATRAEMQAQMAVTRAEMAALRPQMEAEIGGALAGMRGDELKGIQNFRFNPQMLSMPPIPPFSPAPLIPPVPPPLAPPQLLLTPIPAPQPQE